MADLTNPPNGGGTGSTADDGRIGGGDTDDGGTGDGGTGGGDTGSTADDGRIGGGGDAGGGGIGGGSTTPNTPPAPGERRLAHPPSDRYRPADAGRAPQRAALASPRRGLAFGTIAGVAGAVAIVILGSTLTVTAGLLVVAAATGWAVGVGLRVGGGAPPAGGGRVRTALAVAVVAIAVGQLGLWAYARSEGGVLTPLDFLWQAYGGLVPVEFVAAAIAAWIAAR